MIFEKKSTNLKITFNLGSSENRLSDTEICIGLDNLTSDAALLLLS